MGVIKTLVNYYNQKLTSSLCLHLQRSISGDLIGKRIEYSSILKHVRHDRLTYMYRNEGNQMAPSIPEKDLLLVRKIPYVQFEEIRLKYRDVFVGDVIVFKDPLDSDKHFVRRVVADGGYEMTSSDEKDEPFVLGHDEFWVLSDNKDLKLKEAKDSRTFGPISDIDIVGRVIYRMQSAEDHGTVENSKESREADEAVLDVELDIDVMASVKEL